MQDLERDDSPQFKNNLFIFFLCFVLSVLAGSLVANLFSGGRMRALVLSRMEKSDPQAIWDLGDIKLVLSSQGIPKLAVWASHLKVQRGDSCQKALEVSALDVEISLSIWSLIQGPVRLSGARLGNVDILRWPGLNHCLSDPTAASLPNVSAQTSQSGEEKSYGSINPASDLPELPLNHLEVGRLTLRSPVLPVEVLLEDIEASSSGARVHIRADVKLMADDRIDLAPFRIEADSQDLFGSAQVLLRWREATLRSQVDGLRKPPVRVQAQASKFPTLEIYRLLRLLKIVKNDVALGSNWVDFSATLAHEPKRILFEKIQLGGDVGVVRGEELEFVLEPKLELRPFEAKLERLHLSEIVKALQVEPVSRTMASPGDFVGELKYGGDSIHVKGRVEKAQILLTREGRRTLQEVEKIDTEIQFTKPGQLSLEMNNATIHGGRWTGGLKVQASLTQKEAELNLDFDELELDPRVFDALYGMKLGRLSGKASAKLKNGLLTDLKGGAKIAVAGGKTWDLSNGTLEVLYKDGRGEGLFTAEKLIAKPENWEHARVFERALGTAEMSQLRGPLSFQLGTYHVGPIAFKVGQRGSVGKIAFDYGDSADGEMSLFAAASKNFAWNLKGTVEGVQLQPKDALTRELHSRALDGEPFKMESLRPGHL